SGVPPRQERGTERRLPPLLAFGLEHRDQEEVQREQRRGGDPEPAPAMGPSGGGGRLGGAPPGGGRAPRPPLRLGPASVAVVAGLASTPPRLPPVRPRRSATDRPYPGVTARGGN